MSMTLEDHSTRCVSSPFYFLRNTDLTIPFILTTPVSATYLSIYIWLQPPYLITYAIKILSARSPCEALEKPAEKRFPTTLC